MTTLEARTQDRPLLGVLLMLGFCIVIPVADALAKLLGQDFPLFQLIFIRFALQAALFTPIALMAGAALFPTPRLTLLVALRGGLQIIGLLLMFSALRLLPLADAVAIAFVLPFLMLLAGWFFLDEVVGPRRLAACAVGFLGTLMVVQPSFAAVGWGALLPLGVAVIFTIFILVTRMIAKDIDPLAMQATSGLLGVPVLLPLVLLATGPAGLLGWTGPVGTEIGLLALMGAFGAVGHLLMTWSLRFAPSATLAPMQYLEIPVATLVGFLMFRDLPNGLAAIGICVTIAAGLYIILRERATAS